MNSGLHTKDETKNVDHLTIQTSDYSCPTQWLPCEAQCEHNAKDAKHVKRHKEKKREKLLLCSLSTFDCPSREIVRYYHLYERSCWYCSCHHQNSRVLIKRRAFSLSFSTEKHAHSLPAILLPALTVTVETSNTNRRQKEAKKKQVK